MYNLHNGERNNHWQSNHSLKRTRGCCAISSPCCMMRLLEELVGVRAPAVQLVAVRLYKKINQI